MSDKLRPSSSPAGAGGLVVRALGLLVVAAFAGATVLAGSALRDRPADQPRFLSAALGSSVATAPERRTAAGLRVSLPRSGYALETAAHRVAVSSADPAGSSWQHFERGATRPTPFGAETVVVDGDVVEQFLTVTKRTGPRTWRWRLETGTLEPHSRVDGSVLVSAGNEVAGFRVLPAAILDNRGRDVSPAGTAWRLERRSGSWWLALDVDDAELPLPYVIDPATIALRAAQGANNGGGATTLTITKPAGLAVNDQMVAQVTVRGGTGTFVCAPAGWTSFRRDNSGTTLAQELFRKTAVAADVAAASFTFTLDNNAGCPSPLALKASGGIVAHYGVDNSSPISASSGQANASSANIAAPTITPGANDVILGAFGTARGTTITPPVGAPTFTEAWDQQSSGGGATTRTASELATALSPGGATGTKTAVAAAAAVNIGQLASVRLDSTAPTAPALTLSETDADTHASGTTLYYRPGGNGGSFTVDATSTETGSGITYMRFPGLTGGFTPTTNTDDTTPLYSHAYSWAAGASDSGAKTVTVTDNATNANTSTFTLTADSGAPGGGALTVNGVAASGGGTASYDTDGSFAIGSRTDWTDAVSGIASSTLTREDGTLAADACSSYGAPATLVGTPAQSGLATGCYRYTLTGTDNVGNSSAITTVVKVDTSDPSAPSLTLSDTGADVHTSGTTAYYHPSGTGSFDVTASSGDADSGIASYSFPTLAGFTVSGSGTSRTYTLATPTEPDGAKTVTAQNNAGRTNSSAFTLTADSGAPTGGALTVNGVAASGGGTASTSSGSFTIVRTDYSDAASGLATSTLTRDSAPFSNDSCGAFSGSPTTIVGAPAQTLGAGCYEYVLTGTDLVGNTVSISTVVQVHGAATQIALTGSTANLTSGANRVLTATIRDAAGNTVTSDSSTVIAFAKQSGAGTVSGNGNSTAANGVATKTIAGDLAGAVTMEAAAAGLTTGTLGAFTVIHGAAAQIQLSGSTADLASGTNRLLTATVQDAAGNTVTTDNSTVIAFAQAAGAGTVSGAGNATSSNGVASTTIAGVLAGSVTMEATAAGLTTGTLGAFTVVHGAAAQIQLAGSTADLASGTNRVLTATIQDAAGNTVTSDNSTVIAFAQAAGAGTVTGTGNATSSGGAASKTITGQLAGSVTMEAASAGLTTGSLGAFTVVHGAAALIQLSESGSTASGDNHTLTATITDAAGNTATGDSSTVVTFAKTAGAGTVTGLGNATAANGVATKVVVNAAAGPIDLDAQAPGLTTGTASYTIGAGTASTATSTISASPTSIVADGSSTSAITVQLKDAAGNDLTGSGGTVALGLTGAGSLSAVTDNGDGTYSATLTSPTTAGSASVTGTLNAAALVSTAGVAYTHGPATKIALSESGSNVAGNAHTLTATIQDANGNTVTSDSSTVVSFAKTGGPGTVTGLGNATASNGVATKNVTNQLAGQIDLDAQAAGLATGTTSYTIAVGPVSAAASDSTVVAAPASVYANGSDTATITVTLRDAAGNGVAGKTVTLSQGSGSSSISGGGSTNGAGVVTFTVSDSIVESVTYTATDATDSITLADDAVVDFTFQDATPPTNTITLGSATRASLSGSTLYYNGATGGSFTLSSAVADAGAGPASAAYPSLARPGWTHNAETVSTPAGGPYVSTAFTFAAASTGDFTYDVTASDAWAPPNTSQTTLNLTEDSTAPAASILCNGAACSAGWYVAAPVSVTLAAPDAGAGLDQIRYTTDGSDPTIFTGSVYLGAFTVATEGVTTVKYRAFDRVGNDTGVQSQAIRIDTVAPETTIDSAPAAASQDTTPTFAFSSSEAGSTFQVRIDGGSWTSETSPLTLGPLAEGTYTFDVRATDVAGNVDASPSSFTFTVDTTPANTTITSSPAASTNATGASFSFTASDAGPSFECRLDGAAFGDCSSPESYAGLSEASHTFEVRAKDAAGNVDPTPASHSWTVDLTAPDTSFLSTPSSPSSNTTPTFGLASTESPSSFECDLDGAGWASCATPYTTPALGDGSHTLDVRATDTAGNTDGSPVSYAWVVDATAPTGSVTSPANGADVGGTVVLTGNSDDSGGSGVATVTFQRSPAGAGTWANQAASWDTTLQSDGDYDVRVVTTDNAGNVFTSAAITITVDNTAPTLSVGVPNPINLATPDPAPVTATATDTGTGIASVEFEQCNEGSATCTSDTWTSLGVDTTAPYGVSWAIPADGTRLLRVRATDNAGRQDTELVLATIDRTRPTGMLTSPAAGANLRGASVALAAAASDTNPGTVNTVTFQRSPAGAGSWTDVETDPAAPYTATLDTTSLADGLYDLRVFTTDSAGNAEVAPATIQVRVDNTLPTGAVTSPAASANVRGTIALASSSADGGSGVASVQFQRSPAGAGTWTPEGASWDTTLVADGQYDLRVVTTDNAGNAFTSAGITVRVDNTLPSGSVTSPAAAANVRGTIGLTSDSTDAGSGVGSVQFQRSPVAAGIWLNQAASFDTTLVADGEYDLRVVTTDSAGNSFTSSAITIRIDNTVPTGDLTAPADGAEFGVAPIALASDSADAGSGVASIVFERRVAGSGGAWTPTAAPWNTASGPDAVADGSYELRVTTTDNAGNSFSSAFVTVLVDRAAPVTSASLAPGTPSNAPVTVSFSAADGAGSGVGSTSYSVDGGSVQQGAAVVIGAPGDHSNDGSHVVQFFSTDQVGNAEAPQTVTVVIDTTAPSGSAGDPGDYLRGIANLTYATSATDVSSVQFQFSPAGAGSWSSIGGADIAPPYEASWTTTLVADGPYDLRAVVTDSTGNVANELLPGLPKTVDNTAPIGSVTAPAASAYVSGSINVDATATDGAVPPASGISAVRFEVKPFGAGAFTVLGTQVAPIAGSTYRQPLATGSLADGPAELRVVVTDVAGNETTSATRTVTVDNLAPTVALNDPGAAISGTVTLGVVTSADTAQVVFERSDAGAGSWTTIDADVTPGDGFTADLAAGALPDGLYDLRARATDGGGNSTTSATRTTLVDNTLPTGSLTSPGASAAVGGPAVQLAVSAADGGSGVASIAFEVKEFGSATFDVVGTDASAPYELTWDATSAPDGATEIRAVVTDVAGNSRLTAVVPVTVDSTGPSVGLNDPGAVVSGTIALSASSGGGAVRVAFGVSPAGAGTWTEIGSDLSPPFGASFDTGTLPDGLYDLRAIGYDTLGNASTPSVRGNVRFDNVAPSLVSSTPGDGSVSTSANQIALTANEPVTAAGVELDGAPAPAPAVSGSTLTFPTGALSDGLHVLMGELVDAGGMRTPFRVAVTIESSPSADPPPVERSITSSGDWTMTIPGGLVTVRMPQSAWPTPPTPQDYILVLRVDAGASTAGFAPGTRVVEVTARWAIAGTYVTEFREPIEIIFSNPTGAPVIPAWSANGTSSWNTIGPIHGTTLPTARRDGFHRDSAGVHVLTRHLTFFGLMVDDQAPTPPIHIAGVVLDGDGLTLRWIPGTDSSGQLGNVLLLVNGEDYRLYGPTELEAKLGSFSPGDTRRFTLVQYDAAGNRSAPTPPLRAVPPLAGRSLEQASAALIAAGFTVGSVREETNALHAPGTVIAPADLRLAVESTSIDLVVARAPGTPPQTRLVFAVVGAKTLTLTKRMTIGVRVTVSRPAQVTATLLGAKKQRLHTWRQNVKAGATVVKLRLPSQIRRPGTYTISFVARAGTETIRRQLKVQLVGPKVAQVRPKKKIDVVLTGDRAVKGVRVIGRATPDETFALAASASRNVGVVVADVDAHGVVFVGDLHTVFPALHLIAVSREPALRARALRAGAVLALPRSSSPGALGKAIIRISGR